MATTRTSANADEMNDRLLDLLGQVLENQAAHATADLHERIAEQLLASTRRYDPGPTGLSDEQNSIIMRFRALRTGLGNLSRLSTHDPVLMPPPLLFGDGVLTFADPLPADAFTVRLFGPNGRQFRRIDGVGGAQELSDAGDVVYLQVDDQSGTPILLGVPLRSGIIAAREEQS